MKIKKSLIYIVLIFSTMTTITCTSQKTNSLLSNISSPKTAKPQIKVINSNFSFTDIEKNRLENLNQLIWNNKYYKKSYKKSYGREIVRMINKFKLNNFEHIYKVIFSNDMRFLLVVFSDRSAQLFSLDKNKVLLSWGKNSFNDRGLPINISPNGKYVAIGKGNKIYVWSIQNGELIFQNLSHELDDEIERLTFSSDSNLLITCSVDEVKAWNMKSGKLLHKWIKFRNGLCNPIVSSNNKYIAIPHGYPGSYLEILSIVEKQSLKMWATDNKARVVFDLETNSFFAAYNKKIENISLSSKEIIESWETPNEVEYLKFLPNEKILITASDKLRYWTLNGNILKIINTPSTILSPDLTYAVVKHMEIGSTAGTCTYYLGFGLAIPDQLKGIKLLQYLVKKRAEYILQQKNVLSPELIALEKSLNIERKKIMSNKPSPPTKLVKSEFESTASFNNRVASVKTNYQIQVTKYQNAIDKYNKKINKFDLKKQSYIKSLPKQLPRWQNNMLIEQCFFEIFGQPQISKVKYDADTQFFFFDIISNNKTAEGFNLTMSVGPIQNNVAEEFKKKLCKTKPSIIFNLNQDGVMKPKNAEFYIDNTLYSALPIDKSFEPVVMVVEIGEINVPTLNVSKLKNMNQVNYADIKIDLSKDPEIANLQLKLHETRKQKAASRARQEEIQRLKSEIALLQSKKTEFETGSSEILQKLKYALPITKHTNKEGIAVIIGNRTYSKYNKDIPDVIYAHNDSELIKNFLIKSLGYTESNILFFKDATQAQLISTFGSSTSENGRLFDLTKPNLSEIFVFYSGHGAPGIQNMEGYLLPIDANPATVELNGYPLKTLYSNLSKIPARSIAIVIDSCFSGISDGGAIVQAASPALLKIKNQTNIPNNLTLLTATKADEIASWDKDARLGLFTRYFIEAVSGKADSNGDRIINLKEIKDYLKIEVSTKARHNYSRKQTPVVTGPMIKFLLNN